MLRLSSFHRVFAAAFRSPVGLSLVLLGLAPACIEATEGGPGGGAGEAEVRSCKDACGQLKFFDCADAADHSACFGACEEASTSAIDVFVSCVQNDICDPACVNDLVQQASPPAGEGGGGGVTEGDGCVDACEAFVADGCIEAVDCAAACAVLPADERGLLAYCEARRSGCELPRECAGELEPDPTAECRDACDSLVFFDCIDAEQHADCRSLCGSVDDDARDSFAACAGDGICTDGACYDVLAGGGGGEGGGGEGGGAGEGGSAGGSVQELCAAGCDDMKFWDCIDAEQHATCRSRCNEAEDARAETFLGCLGIDPTLGGIGTCDDATCYETFVAG